MAYVFSVINLIDEAFKTFFFRNFDSILPTSCVKLIKRPILKFSQLISSISIIGYRIYREISGAYINFHKLKLENILLLVLKFRLKPLHYESSKNTLFSSYLYFNPKQLFHDCLLSSTTNVRLKIFVTNIHKLFVLLK